MITIMSLQMVWSVGLILREWNISQQKQLQSITDPANLVCEMVQEPGCHPEIRKEFGYVTDSNQFIHLHLVENEKYDNIEIV